MVYVERRAADDAALLKDESFGAVRNQLCTFREGGFSPPPRGAGRQHAAPDGFVPGYIRLVSTLAIPTPGIKPVLAGHPCVQRSGTKSGCGSLSQTGCVLSQGESILE